MRRPQGLDLGQAGPCPSTWLLPPDPWSPSELWAGWRTCPQYLPGGPDSVGVEDSTAWHCPEIFVVLLDLNQAMKTWIWERTFRQGWRQERVRCERYRERPVWVGTGAGVKAVQEEWAGGAGCHLCCTCGHRSSTSVWSQRPSNSLLSVASLPKLWVFGAYQKPWIVYSPWSS